jgi:hypothetical protein
MYRQLNEARKTLDRLRHWWDTSTTVYVDRADWKPGDNAWLREREISEYPENDRAYWFATYHELGELIAFLQETRNMAARRYNELREPEKTA